MADLLEDFYRQNEWANLALIDACRPLTDEQLDATAEGTYGSIRDTLNHIVGAEGGYAELLGYEPAVRLRHSDPWRGLDHLADAARAAADSFVAAVREGSEEMLSGRDYEFEPAVVLVQVVHHGTDHRSQICTILTTLGIEPPELSSWDWGMASGRMRHL